MGFFRHKCIICLLHQFLFMMIIQYLRSLVHCMWGSLTKVYLLFIVFTQRCVQFPIAMMRNGRQSSKNQTVMTIIWTVVLIRINHKTHTNFLEVGSLKLLVVVPQPQAISWNFIKKDKNWVMCSVHETQDDFF